MARSFACEAALVRACHRACSAWERTAARATVVPTGAARDGRHTRWWPWRAAAERSTCASAAPNGSRPRGEGLRTFCTTGATCREPETAFCSATAAAAIPSNPSRALRLPCVQAPRSMPTACTTARARHQDSGALEVVQKGAGSDVNGLDLARVPVSDWLALDLHRRGEHVILNGPLVRHEDELARRLEARELGRLALRLQVLEHGRDDLRVRAQLGKLLAADLQRGGELADRRVLRAEERDAVALG
mmetsp:Transcript_10593/g.33354  ORF Transcript_10593/g.33354 Transcript_10593/m.33354 type:complete len:247 (-) Transcript_10593:58-798(-)